MVEVIIFSGIIGLVLFILRLKYGKWERKFVKGSSAFNKGIINSMNSDKGYKNGTHDKMRDNGQQLYTTTQNQSRRSELKKEPGFKEAMTLAIRKNSGRLRNGEYAMFEYKGEDFVFKLPESILKRGL